MSPQITEPTRGALEDVLNPTKDFFDGVLIDPMHGLNQRPGAKDRFQAGLDEAPKAAPFKRNDAMLELLPAGALRLR